MNRLITTSKSLLSTWGLYVSLVAFIIAGGYGDVQPYDYAKELQHEGYSTDTVEQIIEATKSESYYVRSAALKLLTQRIQKGAIPQLQKALFDPKFEVRFDAAHLLGTLGDKSGLEVMRRDFKEFTSNDSTIPPEDQNVADANQVKQSENRRNLRLYYGLRAARVLGELSDRRGYELAKTMALHGTWPVLRQEAVYVLSEIAKSDAKTLSAERKDPVSILCHMAESERDQAVFSSLISVVQKLDSGEAMRVLEKAANSSHQSEKMRNVAKLALRRVKDKEKGSKQ